MRASSPCTQVTAATGVLLVGNNAAIVRIVTRQLNRLGCRVAAANDGLEAWENYKNEPDGFDLVVTYGDTPGINGNDLAGRISQFRPDLPVVILRGPKYLKEQKASYLQDFIFILTRPFPKAILQKLFRILAMAHL